MLHNILKWSDVISWQHFSCVWLLHASPCIHASTFSQLQASDIIPQFIVLPNFRCILKIILPLPFILLEQPTGRLSVLRTLCNIVSCEYTWTHISTYYSMMFISPAACIPKPTTRVLLFWLLTVQSIILDNR